MEENKVVEIVEAVETEGTEKKGFFGKVADWTKNHKKGLAITAGVVFGLGIIGTVVEKFFSKDVPYDEDEDYVEFDEEETSDETEEE